VPELQPLLAIIGLGGRVRTHRHPLRTLRCRPLPRFLIASLATREAAADRNRLFALGLTAAAVAALRQGAGLAVADLAWSMVLIWAFDNLLIGLTNRPAAQQSAVLPDRRRDRTADRVLPGIWPIPAIALLLAVHLRWRRRPR